MIKTIKIRKKKIVFIVFTIFLILALLLFTTRLRVLFEEFCYMKAKVITIETINEVILNEMKDISYEDLVKYEQNSEGKISLVRFNTVLMNTLSSKITLEIQRSLSSLEKNEIKIPLRYSAW